MAELDSKVKLTCFKPSKKKKERTYIYGLYKFLTKDQCESKCNKLKKKLGTSMLCESEAEMKDTNINKKKRKKNLDDIDDPVFSFGGNLKDEIKAYLIKEKIVPGSRIVT